MARLVDLLTRASKGRLTFDRFEGGLIIADAIYADVEPKLQAYEGDPVMYIEDEPVFEGQALDLTRYDSVLPPYDSFWIEARSAIHRNVWVGVMCNTATPGARTDEMRAIHRELNLALKGMGASLGDAIDYGWVLNMYPILAVDHGGGRLQVVYTQSCQRLMIDKEGKLMTPHISLHDAPDLYQTMLEAFRGQPPMADVTANVSLLVMETLAMMSCVNVKQETVSPPPDLSKSHQKKYGMPMSSYKVLTFKGRNLSEIPPTPKGGTHASPREHKVRRHYRMRGGKRFLVSPYMRGNPALGSVAKTYDVRPLEGDDHGTE